MAKTIYTNDYRKLIDTIREARERSGMSQTSLANRLGRSQQWVSQMERASRRLDVIEFVEVCQALGLEPQALLSTIAQQIEGRSPRPTPKSSKGAR